MDSVNVGVENLDMPPVVEMKYIVPGPPPYYAAPVSPRAAPPSPRAGEAFIRQPESIAGLMNQWMAWDAKEQQLLRQNCNVAAGTRGVYTPEVFAPSNCLSWRRLLIQGDLRPRFKKLRVSSWGLISQTMKLYPAGHFWVVWRNKRRILWLIRHANALFGTGRRLSTGALLSTMRKLYGCGLKRRWRYL